MVAPAVARGPVRDRTALPRAGVRPEPCAVPPRQQRVPPGFRGPIPVDIEVERCPVAPELGRDVRRVCPAIGQGSHHDAEHDRRHFAGAPPVAASRAGGREARAGALAD